MATRYPRLTELDGDHAVEIDDGIFARWLCKDGFYLVRIEAPVTGLGARNVRVEEQRCIDVTPLPAAWSAAR